MKIIESQSAVLTNHEVYEHLAEQRRRYKRDKRRGPPNLETVVREVAAHQPALERWPVFFADGQTLFPASPS